MNEYVGSVFYFASKHPLNFGEVYKLNEIFHLCILNYFISEDFGLVLNQTCDNPEITTFIIYKAQIKPKDIADLIRIACVGDVVNVPFTILERLEIKIDKANN